MEQNEQSDMLYQPVRLILKQSDIDGQSGLRNI